MSRKPITASNRCAPTTPSVLDQHPGLAHDEIEREGVYVHFARLKIQSGRFAEAHAHLNAVTNEMYADLKKRLVRTLTEKENEAKGTNAPPARVE